jgi:hypothetical protein
MNLKESFRYQKFLERTMNAASTYAQNINHCLTTTKMHLRSQSNPDAKDEVEIVDYGEFAPTDVVLKFMEHLVSERLALSTAIGKAKAGIDFDLDAAVEANKFRQMLSATAKGVLRFTGSKGKTTEIDYKFNVNNEQVSYRYPVEVAKNEAYDRMATRQMMRSAIAAADDTSVRIDAAMINTMVDYTPPYDVNFGFEDALEQFVKDNPELMPASEAA